jgi:hypothetical protein
MVKQSVGSVLGNSNGQQGNNPVKTLKGLFGH